jgi:hypothetical protein
MKSSVRAFLFGFLGVAVAVGLSFGAFAIAGQSIDEPARVRIVSPSGDPQSVPGSTQTPSATPTPSETATPSATASSSDDHGGHGDEPGDDHGGRGSDSGDDHGGSDNSGPGGGGSGSGSGDDDFDDD